jgi:hypothetical protein
MLEANSGPNAKSNPQMCNISRSTIAPARGVGAKKKGQALKTRSLTLFP